MRTPKPSGRRADPSLGTCAKVFYATETEAKRDLSRIKAEYVGRRKNRRHPISIYPCKQCGGYHLTSQSTRPKDPNAQ